jgi:hypothetical protein
VKFLWRSCFQNRRRPALDAQSDRSIRVRGPPLAGRKFTGSNGAVFSIYTVDDIQNLAMAGASPGALHYSIDAHI